MPLAKGNSRDVVSHNISELIQSGRSRDQAVAIALHAAGQVSKSEPHRTKRAGGGSAPGAQMASEPLPWYARREAGGGNDPSAYGLISSTIPGRTDRHNTDLPAGSYVLPADVVSGMGEGNSMAGALIIDKALHTNPYGIHGERYSNNRNTIPKAPSAYQTEEGSYRMSHLRGAEALAKGGRARKFDHPKVPVVLAGGEFVVPPHTIAYHPHLGGGDPDNPDPKAYQRALLKGHKVLDAFVLQQRDQHIATLKRLPPPER
jgi:hypothetical protein